MDSLIEKIEADTKEKIVLPAYAGKIRTVSGKVYFLKTGANGKSNICEANGLGEIRKSNTIKVSKVISVSEEYILTEYIEQAQPEKDFFVRFGYELAEMHRYIHTGFGFYENNFIGKNPQLNIPGEQEKYDWAEFYFNKRLLFQYRLAEKREYASDRLSTGFVRLEKIIGTILGNNQEKPSLLHGDLWAGNFLCNTENQPVLIDPAVYYGNRETDLAMTKLFGGFPPVFYESYHRAFPLQEGWQYRENIYKLYHVLNHLNIFGSAYLREAENLLWGYLK